MKPFDHNVLDWPGTSRCLLTYQRPCSLMPSLTCGILGIGANPLQLDIYGEPLDSLYSYNKHVMRIGFDVWTRIRQQLNWLCDTWHQPGEGIWDRQGGRRHFVYSG